MLLSIDRIEHEMAIAGFPPEVEMRVELISPKIMCVNCAEKVQSAIYKMDGVASVVIDVDKKTIAIDFDRSKSGLDDIKDKLIEIGFPAD